MQKKKIILVILSIIIVIGAVCWIVIASKKTDKKETPNKTPQKETNNVSEAPSKIDTDEKDLSKSKAKELYNFIPKVYAEGITPFDSSFMLDAVMNKIMDEDEEQDFSTLKVDSKVKKIFGLDAKIDKTQISEPDINKSIFYYSKEADSYAVIPVGYEGIYKYQFFKNATETNDKYYVYTYALIGRYSYDQTTIIQDENGELNYENAKVDVIVGDKNGNDLKYTFDTFQDIYSEKIWTQKFANKMPVFRYTLTKSGSTYYITEVEQLNY